jgi:hypothetical protein
VIKLWIFLGTEPSQVLKAKDVDPRAELFVRATTVGKEMQSATRKLLLRLRLLVYLHTFPTIAHVYISRQQAELVVKPPKGQQGAMHVEQFLE